MLYIKYYDDLPTATNATYELLDENAIRERLGFSLIASPRVNIKEPQQMAKFEEYVCASKMASCEPIILTNEQINQLTLKTTEYCVIAPHSKKNCNKVGYSLFADKKIPKGFIIPYCGEILFTSNAIIDSTSNSYEFNLGCTIKSTSSEEYTLTIDPKEFGGLARFTQYAFDSKVIEERIIFEKPIHNLAVPNLITRQAFLIDENTKNPILELMVLETTTEVDAGHILCWNYFGSFARIFKYFRHTSTYPELFTKTGQIISIEDYYFKLYLLPHHVTLNISNESHDTEWLSYSALVNKISKNQQFLRNVESTFDGIKITVFTLKNEYNNSWQPRRGFYMGRAEKHEYLLTAKDLQDYENLLQVTYKTLYPTESVPSFKLEFVGNFNFFIGLTQIYTDQQKINLFSAIQELSNCYGENWGISNKISCYDIGGDIIDIKQQYLIKNIAFFMQNALLILEVRISPDKIYEKQKQQTQIKSTTFQPNKKQETSNSFLSSGFAKGFLLSSTKSKPKLKEVKSHDLSTSSPSSSNSVTTTFCAPKP